MTFLRYGGVEGGEAVFYLPIPFLSINHAADVAPQLYLIVKVIVKTFTLS
jgi:hypothetical protein